MPPERITSGEAFTANLANIWLVTRMNSAVPLEIVLTREGAWADGTCEWLELRVRAEMRFEVVRAVLGESLVAVGIRAFGNTVDVDASVHGVAKGVDHVACVGVHAVMRHEARVGMMHAIAVRAGGRHHTA